MMKRLMVIVSVVAVAGFAIAATTAGEGKATFVPQHVLNKKAAGSAKSVARPVRAAEGAAVVAGARKTVSAGTNAAEGYSGVASLDKAAGAGAREGFAGAELSNGAGAQKSAATGASAEGFADTELTQQQSKARTAQGQGLSSYNPGK